MATSHRTAVCLSSATSSNYQNMLGPILPRRYVGPNVNYTDSTNIEKRRQQTVEMGFTHWEAGLTSSDISISPFIVMPRRSIVMPRRYLLSVPQASKYLLNLKPSNSWVVAGNTDILLAALHRTTVCLSSATSSSCKNIQLTSSYISFYKDQ
mgnify:CR=1 FL=1